jgi:hypothetical protein
LLRYAVDVGQQCLALSVEVFTMTASGLTVRIWNDAGISRRDADGYVNATQMAKANGKHLPHYMANDRTREYLEALSGSVGIPTDQLVATTMTGPNALRGTWIHPRLAVDLARWISPEFAVWMDGWFLESMQPQSIPRPEPIDPITEGIAVFATSKRQAIDLWRQAVQQEVASALACKLGTKGLVGDRSLPLLPNCRWMPIDPPISRDDVVSVAPPIGGFTTHAIIEALGHSITRANEMYVAAQLRQLGYVKHRQYVSGRLSYRWHPPQNPPRG